MMMDHGTGKLQYAEFWYKNLNLSRLNLFSRKLHNLSPGLVKLV